MRSQMPGPNHLETTFYVINTPSSNPPGDGFLPLLSTAPLSYTPFHFLTFHSSPPTHSVTYCLRAGFAPLISMARSASKSRNALEQGCSHAFAKKQHQGNYHLQRTSLRLSTGVKISSAALPNEERSLCALFSWVGRTEGGKGLPPSSVLGRTTKAPSGTFPADTECYQSQFGSCSLPLALQETPVEAYCSELTPWLGPRKSFLAKFKPLETRGV